MSDADLTPTLALIGGFLGAGKTTLLWQAAHAAAARGLRVGLVTNDQAPDLVDTAVLANGAQVPVQEVSGSCFCCNFPGLLRALGEARGQAGADLLLAEPVGSCTDLSATILQPLKELNGRDYRLSPLSVLADPLRLRDLLDGGCAGLHPSAAYIMRTQLAEADMVVISKCDLISTDEELGLTAAVHKLYPQASVLAVSAHTEAGLEAWLDRILAIDALAGTCITQVDYDRYAEGEAVLGWLNAAGTLCGPLGDGRDLMGALIAAIDRHCAARAAGIGHVKLLLEAGGRQVIANLTGRNALQVRGMLSAGSQARLVINARVQMMPPDLDALIDATLAEVLPAPFTLTLETRRCLSPGRPQPTHRYDRIVTVGGA